MSLELFGNLVEHRLALIERLIKAILFGLKIGLASREVLGELGIDVLILLTNRLSELNRKARGDAEETAVANSAADETTKNVVRSDIAGLDATLRITENERRRTHVIGDDAARLERELRVFGRYGRKFVNLRHDRRKNLGIINGRRARHHADRALNAHTRIDVMTTERLERAFSVLVVLHENIVPDFDVLTAVTTGTAIGTALLLTRIDEHFGIRTAGTGRTGGTPPVVFARETVNALVGNTERLPNFNGLLVSRNVARLALDALTLKYRY